MKTNVQVFRPYYPLFFAFFLAVAVITFFLLRLSDLDIITILLIELGVFGVPMLFIGSIKYTISDDVLHITSLLFVDTRISISDISKIQKNALYKISKSKNYGLIAPKSHIIRVVAGDTTFVLTPSDVDAFVDALIIKNPNIEVV